MRIFDYTTSAHLGQVCHAFHFLLGTLGGTEHELEKDLPCVFADAYSSEDDEYVKILYVHSDALIRVGV